MKKVTKIATGLTAGLGCMYWSVLSVFAAPSGGTLCPAGDFNSLCAKTYKAEDLVKFGINIVLFVAFVAALLWLIFGGIRWITSGGDKEGTAKAKGTVTSALIGLVIVLGAWILINVILQFFGLNGLGSLTLPNIQSIPST